MLNDESVRRAKKRYSYQRFRKLLSGRTLGRAYLDEEEEIRVLALGGGAVPLLDVVAGDVDTLHDTTR